MHVCNLGFLCYDRRYICSFTSAVPCTTLCCQQHLFEHLTRAFIIQLLKLLGWGILPAPIQPVSLSLSPVVILENYESTSHFHFHLPFDSSFFRMKVESDICVYTVIRIKQAYSLEWLNFISRILFWEGRKWSASTLIWTHVHLIYAVFQVKECRKDNPCKNVLFGQMTVDKYLSKCSYF